ncbi:MAG: DUF3857 and transglutaminase domain-containing protein [Gemmatimonadota bacterium]|nr:DUF3857 and transglutaminase domain-containing protein [Gemmatimonadota bacterium]
MTHLRLASPLAVAILAATAAAAHAQTWAAGPAGDDGDLTALIVDAADYRGHDAVLLIDDGEIRLEPDGASAFTQRRVIQLFNQSGADEWGTLTFRYDPERERLRLNWLRVLDLEGNVVSTGPGHVQETTDPTDPALAVYTNDTFVQMAVSGVAGGRVLDYSYTYKAVAPRVAGDLSIVWQLNSLRPVRRSRFALDAPADAPLIVREANIGVPPKQVEERGRIRRTWTAEDEPGVVLQSYAAFPNDEFRVVGARGDIEWDDVGRWYHGLLSDRYTLTPEIERAPDAELAGAESLSDSLRATYRWVAQDIRYVSLSLGEGAYQPRPPAEVFASGFGDCKDKATLFVALVRRLGLDAHPVLVSTSGVDSLAPSLHQFDHMIARVSEPDGRHVFADLTDGLAPYGQLSALLEGDVGVVVGEGGDTEVVALPASATDDNRLSNTVRGVIDLDNRFTGSLTLRATGTTQSGLRSRFLDYGQASDSERDELLRGILEMAVWEGFQIDSARVFEGGDLEADADLRIWFKVDELLGGSQGVYALYVPLESFEEPGILAQLESEGERRFPIDVMAVNDPSVYESVFEVELPDGWRATLPEEVETEGVFGSYRATYRQVGNRVTLRRAMAGRRGVEPPDSIGALKRWFEVVNSDDAERIVLSSAEGLDLGQVEPGDEANALGDLLPAAGAFAGAVMDEEGAEIGDDSRFLWFLTPLRSYTRDFLAEQMLFSLGDSDLMYLLAGAQEYETGAEAAAGIEMMQWLDLPGLAMMMFGELGLGDASAVDAEELALETIGDASRGWLLEIQTPLVNLDVGIAAVSVGRVSLALLAVGVAGLEGADVASLLSTMAERVVQEERYAIDLPGTVDEASPGPGFAIADSAGIALDEVLLDPAEFPGAVLERADYFRVDGGVQYEIELSGDPLYLSTGSANATAMRLAVVRARHGVEAVRLALLSESGGAETLLRAALDDWATDDETEAMLSMFLEGGEQNLERLAAPISDAVSNGGVLRHRRGFRMDVEHADFALGRYYVRATIVRAPDGAAPADAIDIVRRMRDNLVALVGADNAAPLDESLVRSVREIVEGEVRVTELIGERDLGAALDLIEDLPLAEVDARFDRATWNSVCWWGALYGHAERVLEYCDLAIDPFDPAPTIVDSRAVARALSGDVDGAIEDLRYVVENAGSGEFLDTRAVWLDMLERGENPFTEEELARLRGDG